MCHENIYALSDYQVVVEWIIAHLGISCLVTNSAHSIVPGDASVAAQAVDRERLCGVELIDVRSGFDD